MSFNVAADAYDRFMGRYSTPLAPLFADFAGVASGMRVLDVGCGPGALTAELERRVGPALVSAVDPSEPFVAAARERFPDVDIGQAPAEDLPFESESFDVALTQLVVHFMKDPVAGLREMRRVTSPGCVVAACVWDFAGGGAPLSLFWDAVRQIDPGADDESHLAGAREGHLGELFRGAGLTGVIEGAITVEVGHATFEEWWEPFTQGVGPAGAYVTGQTADAQERLRELCRSLLPAPPFVVSGRAWAARGVA